jgi:hypothetical protein
MKIVLIALNEVHKTGKMDIHVQIQAGVGSDQDLTVNCDELIKLVRSYDKDDFRIFSDTIEILEVLQYDDMDAKEKLLELIDAIVGEESKYNID